MELGKRLKEYRVKSNMTQDELADKLYVSRQTISSWENDKSYPDIHSLLMRKMYHLYIHTLIFFLVMNFVDKGILHTNQQFFLLENDKHALKNRRKF